MAKFKGNSLASTIYGTSSSDTIDGNGGADTLVGGLGNDIYIVNDANVRISETTSGTKGGMDTVYTSVIINFIAGDIGLTNIENIVLTGTANIYAYGNDLNNAMTGNSGNNTLLGGFGNDTLKGEAGNDSLEGGFGNDSLSGGDGNDTIFGFELQNLLGQLVAENNSLSGGDGNDLLHGALGNNMLLGGNGNDTLIGTNGNNTLIGGTGNDSYVFEILRDVYNPGYLDFAYKLPTKYTITESLNEGTDTIFLNANGYAGIFSYTLDVNIENLDASGNHGAPGTTIQLLNLKGNGLDNDIYGGLNDDTIDGGLGVDTLHGGIGNDTYLISNTLDTILENADEGLDTVYLSRTTGSSYVLEDGVDNLILTNKIAYTTFGNSLDNLITGNAAVNTLMGNDGNDYLESLAGNDNVYGGNGNDYIDGGNGADTMDGGLGDDTFVVDNALDTIIDAGGTDTVIINAQTGALPSSTYNLANFIENAALDGTANISISGNNTANFLAGNIGNNGLYGNAGDDEIEGDAGNDMIVGGDGNDTLHGGLGNDTLVASFGDDQDILVFDTALSATSNVDKVRFFESGNDVIQLDSAIFTSLNKGALNADNFASGTGNAALDTNDFIIYNQTTGDLYYDKDGLGGSSAIKFATFTPGGNDANDAILISDFMVV